ncbi:monooxygenase [Alicyclobacillus hesperidum subsp. aegles]|uniref:LLM class flavin-dependent oxidoreductase n=1 Tax=Alicyclobacillus hesperidum TaxID=89784 RepID=UPI0007191ADD|nr:LLM class flavin-dependent oxidoreductase [Alicyclobacillus hesperidum]KRW92073.1 alkanesulfonate monooxygenase [Alicyclobacillus tengchongensis]GLG00193.1 monooxygenase [Alicyclobacillus hesperidum subsp. aegles]
MRYGFWLPIFGGWLRNVDDESMPPTFEYAKHVAVQAERMGYDVTLIAELYLNDIKGPQEPSLEAWTTASAIAAVTEKLEIMTAIRPAYHNPAVAAKMAANIDQLSKGRFTLNVVSAWWAEEARQYGGIFTEHDDRYARTREFLEVMKGMWTQDSFTYEGERYRIQNARLQPKPLQQPYPRLYAGGESEAGKDMIASLCDAYVMHGGTVEEVAQKISDMRERRERKGLPPLASFGMAAYVICRDTLEEAQAELERITTLRPGDAYASMEDFVQMSQLEQQIRLYDYSVSNRGLRPQLIGTPDMIAHRIVEYERVGLDLLLLQCSPQLEEMRRFAEQVMPRVAELRRTADITA